MHTSTNKLDAIKTNYWEMNRGTEEPMPFTEIYYRSLEVCKAKCTSMKVACSIITNRHIMSRDWLGYGRSRGDSRWSKVTHVCKYDCNFYLGCFNVLSKS